MPYFMILYIHVLAALVLASTLAIENVSLRRLVAHWLPPTRIYHPYPLRRMGAVT